MKPYYDEDGITIYHGDVLDALDLERSPELADVMVTDPPYGILYSSGKGGVLDRAIKGDQDTTLRDEILDWWEPGAALVFGTWKAPRPWRTRMVLVWDTKGALGMGDLSLPWKPSHQEIYVLGSGFSGRRTSDVLTFAPVQSMASNGRNHPHEKPVALMRELVRKCPGDSVLDPFMGTGATLIAAKAEGREAIGVEIEERYCEIAAKRLAQGVLNLA